MTGLNPARRALLDTFALDARIVSGHGCYVEDSEGRRYLDGLAQYGALPFGHNPKAIWQAMTRLHEEGMPALTQPLRPLEAERLAERLAEITPGDLSITTLTNSGAEAVEAAIKLARVRTGRPVILSTRDGFHGKTLGALSATGRPYYQEGFGAPSAGFEHIAFGDLAALSERLADGADDIAAFIVEPIQGEAGVIVPPEGYLDAVIALCRQHGVLVIVDEIQTGLGRTGEVLACSSGAEVPDMVLLAKALGGGVMPIGACIARPSAWDDDFGRRHSSTFANNNVACRAANASLDLLLAEDGKLMRDVAENGAYLHARLHRLVETYPEVLTAARGRGFMAALEFREIEDTAVLAFASHNGGLVPIISSHLFNVEGILTAPLFNASRVMRIQLPLIAGRAEIDMLVDALHRVCALIAARDCYNIVKHLLMDRDEMPAPDEIEADRVASPERADAVNRFAFLVHYTERADIIRADPSFAQFTDAEIDLWCDWVKRLGPGFARRLPAVTSETGATAEGWIMSVPLLPEDMRGRHRKQANAAIGGALDMAIGAGVSRVGLGAFTSIATRGGESVTGRGADVTSGNTLTSVAAVRALEETAGRVGMDLSEAHVVVVGAAGAIGRLTSLMLARRAGRITLCGNAANPFTPRLLSNVADEVCATLLDTLPAANFVSGRAAGLMSYLRDGLRADEGVGGLALRTSQAFQGRGLVAPVEWRLPLDAALKSADIVVVATSAETAILDPRTLAPGTLVCDVARPPNVAQTSLTDDAVMVFDGGLITPPSDIDLGPFQTLPPGLCWGCFGETMLLALAGEEGDYSIGSKLPLNDADRIAVLAERHGFRPAPLQWYGEEIGADRMERFARHVAERSKGRTATLRLG